jgi:Holliday junction resolvasome RuvABC endonuclease subunit
MGVDPGTNYCGVAIFDIDDKTFKIKSLENMLVNLTKPKYDIENSNLLFPRLNILYKTFTNIYKDYDIYWLAIEAAFINRLRPAAYGPIVTSIYCIKKAFLDSYNLNNIVEYPPTVVKQSISEYGQATKDGMYDAVNGILELKHLFNIDKISEHEIDAIGMGYTLIKQIRNTPEILIMK